MKKTLKAALLVSSALVATPALAQNAAPPPDRYALDSRGVDVISGSFNYFANDVSIGEAGVGGLSLITTPTATGSGRHNWVATIDIAISPLYRVSVGQNTEPFSKSGSNYTNVFGSGSTLVEVGGPNTLLYTTADGMKYYFQISTTQGSWRAGYFVSYSVAPNGERIEYYYKVANTCAPAPNGCAPVNFRRIQGVASNTGYVLKFNYASNVVPTTPGNVGGWLNLTGAVASNSAIDPCLASSDSCVYTRTWPSITYGANGQTSTDQAGRTTNYTFENGRLSAVRRPGSAAPDTAIAYGSDGRVSSVVDASGTWSYSYASSGSTRTTTISNNGGTEVITGSSATNQIATYRDQLNRTTSYIYDAQGRLTQASLPEGNRQEFTYDSRGNVLTTTLVPKSGSGSANLTTSATFPASCVNPVTCNLPASTTDARGGVTDYVYDSSHGGVLSVTVPAPTAGAVRPQTRISYAPQTAYYKSAAGTIVAAPSSITLPVSVSSCATNAAPACVGTADEVRQMIQYGSAGVANNLLPTVVTQSDGTGTLSASVTTAYTANGDVASVDGPLPGAEDTTYYRYDTARRPVGVIGPDPDGSGSLMRRAQRVTYDAGSRPTQVDVGAVNGISDGDWNGFVSLQQQLTAYDGFGRPVVVARHGGGQAHAVTHVSYDAAGRQACVAQRMNPAAFNSLPGSACELGAAGAYGPDRITNYQYDEAGRLKQSTSGYLSGSPITEQATYTANGKPLTLKDGAGNVSTMIYDGFDRLSQLRYPDATVGSGTSSTSDYEQYGYDAGSNVISFRNRAGELINSGYDALNRQVAMGGSAIADRTISYDNLNRVKGMNYTGGGASSSNTYDALGRLISQTQAGLGTATYGYDLASRRTSMSWPDGFWVAYDYNLANELTAIRENGATAWSLTSLAYDNLGRPIAQGRANGATTYRGYDGASRLTSLSHDLAGTAHDLTLSFSYNPAGQIITRTMSNPAYAYTPGTGNTAYANNGKNQVTSVNGAGVGYDGRQNITSIPGGGSYGYNGANELTSATVGGTNTGLSYDPGGRLYQVGPTRFLYDGQQAIGEYDQSGALLKRYVPGLGLDSVITAYEGAGYDRRYLLADERRSVVSITDGSANALTTNTYDEYGVPSAANSGRFQYTGQMWLPQAQLYHYRARAYAPQLGRFMQTDPIGYHAGANVYSYVQSDPINLVDSLGLLSMTICVENGTYTFPNGVNVPLTGGTCITFPVTQSRPSAESWLYWLKTMSTGPNVNSASRPSGGMGTNNYIDQIYRIGQMSHCDLQKVGNDVSEVSSLMSMAGGVLTVGSALATPFQPEFAVGVEAGGALSMTGTFGSVVGSTISAVGGDFSPVLGTGLASALSRVKILGDAKKASWDLFADHYANGFADSLGLRVVNCK